MSRYDHRVHAGNAGDVWKHFLLLEAANCLLDAGGCLVYAESHVGYPHYVLMAPGDWQGGIGKIWPLLPSMQNFCYFKILAELNSELDFGFPFYPGSARFIHELAKRKCAGLKADLWDNDDGVAISWQQALFGTGISRPFPWQRKTAFHQADGFSGVTTLLARSSPAAQPIGSQAGLLFIDPPYTTPGDVRLAENLLEKARERGWIVLWWHGLDIDVAAQDLVTAKLYFSEVGLDGGRWKGAMVAFAGPAGDPFDRLLDEIHRAMDNFVEILKLNNIKR
jgi:23S rRNA (adenine2030-N6)-methyltransferase